MRYGHRPQDSVPIEEIIYYIVRDYQRMYSSFSDMERQRDKAMEKEKDATEKRSKLESRYKAKIQELEKEVATLNTRILDMKESRSDVIEAATSALEEQLREAENKIRLLAQAVVEPNKLDSVFLQSLAVHTIETDDDRKWMGNAMKQLEKAAMSLLSAEERLVKCEEALKEIPKDDSVERAVKNYSKVFLKINSTLSHIECFMDKVGDIKIADE